MVSSPLSEPDQTAPRPEGGDLRTVAIDRSITEAAIERIRSEILSGRIQPGERIRLRSLEQLLGVSHIPIREALRRLEGEGLVENVPQKGAIATPLWLTELAEVYELRKILEPMMAVRAVPIGAEQLSRIAEALHDMEAVEEGWRAPNFLELHRRFHWLIIEPGVGGNLVIEQTIRRLWQTSERYVRFAMTVGQQAPVAARHHRRLSRAVKRGDGAALSAELIEHLEHTEAGVRRALGVGASETGNIGAP